MTSVFLSHSNKDKPFVRELAEFLERESDIKVWLDEREIAPGQNIVGRIAKGLESDFILLILSPDSVESNWVKEEWTDAFWEQTNNQKTKLVGVLYRDCKMPKLLRNKRYFDLRKNQPQGFREIRTFLLTERPPVPERVNQLPVRPPIFVGREKELSDLRERLRQPGALVHIAEMPGKGKTTLALEFAHRYQQDFQAVYWLPCQSQDLALIAAELSRLLGMKMEGDLSEVVRELRGVCASTHCLLIFDNVANEAPEQLIPGGAASVLVTSRSFNLRFLNFREPVKLPLFTNDECFEVFRQQLGAERVAQYEAECRHLFARVGNLPIGISISAALIRYDIRYTIASLSRNLPADVTALMREAIKALGAQASKLVTAMSACAPQGFRLDLAARIAGLNKEAALEATQELISRSLAEEVDRTDRRYRLHAIVREAAGRTTLARRHAEAVRDRLEKWETDCRRSEQEIPDVQTALEWALEQSDFAVHSLAHNAVRLMRRVGRLAEAFEISRRMGRASEKEQNSVALQTWLRNQALILEWWGRFDEAFTLHKQLEAICLKFDDKDSLQRSYGNQALILRKWGRLGEALELLTRQEEICRELPNEKGLSRSYGNQAVVLRQWGRLDEALRLHKQEEAICLQLVDEDGLQHSYGNQAKALQLGGRLEEAMALLKKKEEICMMLGNKRSLAHCYWSWGLLEREFGNSESEREKLSAAFVLFQKFGMPYEREAVAAELAKTRVSESKTSSQSESE
jgi:tetratricopeptide (TPR) repeat protein